ncbi:hypothetical protein C8A05DRAFT_17079 [Staphylotrichum tortipilum]|uniref:Defect at low temperature protein 1 n=1 Tax=Staphylotrichum tortipilum TaxID=2831512 RepID=A0AAN6RS01_9PEZI|nr:hypothetical protein C8A05DRAFT_17079 [Staphylotrichum longicolle]
MSAASLLALIVYNFVYYFLYLVLFAFLVVTPVDLIQQSVKLRRHADILIVIICYVVTILTVAFIYAARLYISRSVLASIPKGWVPVEKPDVAPDVRQMIVDALARSAAIAYDARPRLPLVVLSAPEPGGGYREGGSRQASPGSGAPWLSASATKKSSPPSDDAVSSVIEMPPTRPVWGDIEHPGWASPTSPDLPNLQYDTVVSELPNLIEAKAMTLAPPDPASQTSPPTLDPDAVALLQRPESMGLREYLLYLTDLAVLAPLPTTTEFLARYEAARFSGRPLTEAQFRALMHLFSHILHNMHPLSAAALARYGGGDSSSGGSSALAPSESDIDNDAPRGTSPSSEGTAPDFLHAHDTHHHRRSGSRLTATRRDSSSSGDTRLRPRPSLGVRTSSAHTWQRDQYRTAPTTPKSRHTGGGVSRASSRSSGESFAHTRRPYMVGDSSGGGGGSSDGGSVSSAGSGSVVIHPAGSEDETELGYVLMQPTSR